MKIRTVENYWAAKTNPDSLKAMTMHLALKMMVKDELIDGPDPATEDLMKGLLAEEEKQGRESAEIPKSLPRTIPAESKCEAEFVIA